MWERGNEEREKGREREVDLMKKNPTRTQVIQASDSNTIFTTNYNEKMFNQYLCWIWTRDRLNTSLFPKLLDQGSSISVLSFSNVSGHPILCFCLPLSLNISFNGCCRCCTSGLSHGAKNNSTKTTTKLHFIYFYNSSKFLINDVRDLGPTFQGKISA